MKQFECDVYLDLMPLVKDGAASDASCTALKEHLEVCSSCRRRFDDFSQEPEMDFDLEESFQTVRQKLKRKFILAIAALSVLLLIPIVLVFIFCGNPISQFVINQQAKDYLQQRYPGNDFLISEPQYNMKSLGYTVKVESKSSRDTYFVLNFGYFGGDCWDGYDSFVTSGMNTFHRVSQDVRTLLEPALEDMETVSAGLNSDWPSIYDEFGYPFEAPEILDISTLQVDGHYDLKELCGRYGHIEIHAEVLDASAEEICRILRKLYQQLNANELSVRTVDVTVWDTDSSVTVAGFQFSDIPGEELETKIVEAATAWEQFQREYDVWIQEKNRN